ncbi:hypothetical protein KM043_015424 [Ampulex compressa]|nr:hypothetical protein KM043_015424 [Ampulex compressa]
MQYVPILNANKPSVVKSLSDYSNPPNYSALWRKSIGQNKSVNTLQVSHRTNLRGYARRNLRSSIPALEVTFGKARCKVPVSAARVISAATLASIVAITNDRFPAPSPDYYVPHDSLPLVMHEGAAVSHAPESSLA